MKARLPLILAVALGLIVVGWPAHSQSVWMSAAQPSNGAPASAQPLPPLSDAEQFIKDIKNPTGWFSWGGDLRIRNEYYDNALTLNAAYPLSAQDYFRFRGRLWTSVTPLTNVNFYGRISAEPREWMEPASSSPFSPKPFNPSTANSGLEWRYGIVDNMVLRLTNLVNQPLAVAVGRQDVQFGEPLNWWLVADGTPGDGSWTYFMDSARVSYDALEFKTKFDVVYINQYAVPSQRIPTMGSSQGYYLTEQNEKGVIVYVSNKSVQNTTLDGYFIYKGDDRVTSNGDDASIYTLGGKISGTPAEHWRYSVEGAYQFGNKQDPTVALKTVDGIVVPDPALRLLDRNLSTYGGNLRLTYLFKDCLNNQVSLVGEFLSGDDPATTGQDEMFDILWGRYPRWSDLYVFGFSYETGGRSAQMNNLGRVGPSWSVNPIKGMTFCAMYNELFAPQEVPTRRVDPYRIYPTVPSVPQFSFDGNSRGHFVQASLKQQFSKHMSGTLLGEFVWQGDYYAAGDLMTFLRAELMFTF